MHLWLIRHAQPLVERGICYGHTNLAADPAATATAAQTLARALPQGISIHCSTLQRCELLAHCLYALRPDLAYKTSANLREMHFGNWEGRAWNGIPRHMIDAWTADFADYPVGQHGESTRAVVLRVLQALLELDQTDAEKTEAAWITHAGVIRAVHWLIATVVEPAESHLSLTLQTGTPPQHRPLLSADWPQNAPAFGHWHRLRVPQPWQLHQLQQTLLQ